MNYSNELPRTGFVRIKRLKAPHGPIPMCSASIWALVKAGKFPAPVKLSPGVTAWSWESIHRYIAEKQAEQPVQVEA